MSLGQKLIDAGMLTREQWEEAEQAVASEGGFVGAALVERGFVSADALARFLEEAFSIPTLTSGPVRPDPTACDLAPAAFWQEVAAIPLGMSDEVLTVALTRPLDVFVLDRLKKELGLAVRPVFVELDDLVQVLTPSDAQGAAGEVPEGLESSPTVEGAGPERPPPSSAVAVVAGEDREEVMLSVITPGGEAGSFEDSVTEAPDAGEPAAALVDDASEEVPQGEHEDWDDSEYLDRILALMKNGPGWVAVVGQVRDRVPCLRALHRALEQRGLRVIYFSAAARPYGELELVGQTSGPVLMVEDLDALEGHVPEQALLLQEIRQAHARGAGLVVGAAEPPAKLTALEPSLRVAVSLARVFSLGRRVPAWLGAILREASGLFAVVGSHDRIECLNGDLRSGDPRAAVSSAIEACKSLMGGE